MALTKNIAILGYSRWASLGTVTASSSATGYPAPNLLGDALWNTSWRSADGVLSSVDLTFSLGVARPVQAVALVGSNLSDAGQRAVWIGNDPTFATNLDSSALATAFDIATLPVLVDPTPPWGRPVIYLAANEVTAAYVRLRLTDPGNLSGYLAGSIALIENVWQPVRNMATAWSRPDVFRGQEGAQLCIRQLNVPLHRLTQGEEVQIRSVIRRLKNLGRLLIIPSPLSPSTWCHEAIWARCVDPGEATAVDQLGMFRQLTLRFEEVSE